MRNPLVVHGAVLVDNEGTALYWNGTHSRSLLTCQRATYLRVALVLPLHMVVCFRGMQSAGSAIDYGRVFQAMGRPQLIIGPNSIIMDCNKAFCALTGFERFMLRSRCVHDMCVPDARTRVIS